MAHAAEQLDLHHDTDDHATPNPGPRQMVAPDAVRAVLADWYAAGREGIRCLALGGARTRYLVAPELLAAAQREALRRAGQGAAR